MTENRTERKELDIVEAISYAFIFILGIYVILLFVYAVSHITFW